MRVYGEDELLLISGIQHFAFCERQWALIHLEQAWRENVLTVEGRHVHERVDDPFHNETRGDLRVARSVPILSWTLGMHGIADSIEYHKVPNDTLHAIKLPGLDGTWLPRPIEFKRGKPKPDDRDAVQLCAQAICIEEMMGTKISRGDIYYWETRRKQPIELTMALRELTRELASRMHELFSTGVTPTDTQRRPCRSCSLNEVCQPNLLKRRGSVASYINSALGATEEVHE